MSKYKVSLVLIIIFSVIVCVLIGGYVTFKIFTSEKAIKTRMTSILEAATGGRFTIEHAHFDLFEGLSLDGIMFEGKNPEDLRIEVERIFIRHEPLNLLRGEILVNSIVIISPELFIVRKKGALWRFLNGTKALLDHAGLKYPTSFLSSGVTVKAANVQVLDKTVFREGVLDIENLDLFAHPFGGSLRYINIKGTVNNGFWKGLELNAEANLLTPELKLVLRIKDGIMTEELMKEIPVIGEKFWQTYSPVGKYDFDCTLDFNNKDRKREMDYLLELDVIDGEMAYIKWPFLIKHVNGKLEFSREGTFLKSMKGDVQNEDKPSHGEIDAFFGVGSAKKSINLIIPNFNLTETLIKMIPDIGEKVWKDYKPEGDIDLTIKYESNEDKSIVDYSAEAICKGIKANYPDIPYDLSNIVGLIKNDGKKIYFKNMSGYLLNRSKMNRTIFDGEMDLKSKVKRFTVSIPNLDLTEEIVKSIPEKGEEIWSNNKPTGQVDLTINFVGYKDSSKDEYLITADCKGNEVESVRLPVKVSDIMGRIVIDKNNFEFKSLRGYVVTGSQLSHATANGVISLRNKNRTNLFNVLDLRVTEELLDKFPKLFRNEWLKVEPVGWVDVTLDDQISDVSGENRHSIIIDAKGCGIGLANFPFSISDMDGRINIEEGQLTSRNFDGTCYGGNVNGSIKLDSTSSTGAFAGELNFEKVSFQELMKTFTKDQQEWAGMCEGNIEFQGTGKGLENFTAEGSAKLTEGYLSELPALLSILKLLNLSIPKKEPFHTANIKYSIKDKVVNIEKLEVFSDSIELGCVGTAGFDGTIDLIVVAGLNKETFSQIPFIGGLMDFVVGGVRKKLTKVRITGKFSNPESTMIGLKPFRHPIASFFDLINAEEDEGGDADKEDKEEESIESDM